MSIAPDPRLSELHAVRAAIHEHQAAIEELGAKLDQLVLALGLGPRPLARALGVDSAYAATIIGRARRRRPQIGPPPPHVPAGQARLPF